MSTEHYPANIYPQVISDEMTAKVQLPFLSSEEPNFSSKDIRLKQDKITQKIILPTCSTSNNIVVTPVTGPRKDSTQVTIHEVTKRKAPESPEDSSAGVKTFRTDSPPNPGSKIDQYFLKELESQMKEDNEVIEVEEEETKGEKSKIDQYFLKELEFQMNEDNEVVEVEEEETKGEIKENTNNSE